MSVDTFFVDDGAGWKLALKRRSPPAGTPLARAKPVLIVPGYGMNSFIFDFHPRGLSLKAYLASRGIETWSVDLRAQGKSVRGAGASDRYGLGDLAIDDVGAAIARVLKETRTGRSELDLIGASLGAALSFAHLACNPGAKVATMVTMAGLVTWVRPHPILRAAFFSGRVVRRIKVQNTRKIVGRALPLLVRFAPKILGIYLNAASTDLSQAEAMLETVEDPSSHINAEIAEWIARRELIVRGVNVSRALSGMKHPYLCVVAQHDGVVPPQTARAIYDQIGSSDKELLFIGESHLRIAHADLFLSTGAQDAVFAKIADFLLERG